MRNLLFHLDGSITTRLSLFIAFPLVLLVVIYRWPAGSAGAAILGLFILVILILYLREYRKARLPLVLAIAPNGFGPLLANWYAESHLPQAQALLEAGADLLVALAFLWASIVALFLHLLTKPQRSRLDLSTIVFILAVIVLLPGDVFVYRSIASGPLLFAGVSAPNVTPLLAMRLLITFYGTYEAIAVDDSGVEAMRASH